MPTKKITTIFTFLCILFCNFILKASEEVPFNGFNSYTSDAVFYKDVDDLTNFTLKNRDILEQLQKKRIELLEKQKSAKKLSPEEFIFITTYISIIDQQILDQQSKTHTLQTEPVDKQKLSIVDVQTRVDVTQESCGAIDTQQTSYIKVIPDSLNVVNNCAVVILIGGGATVTGPVIPVIVGGGLAIGWIIQVGIPLIRGKKNKNKQKEIVETKNDQNGGSGGNDDDPDKNKKKQEKYPHGIAIDNPKHHINSKGKIGKSIKDKQRALDNTIEVPGEKHRVGIHDGKYVKFMQDGPNSYHGFELEKFTDLDGASQNALVKAKLVRSVKSGKIVK